MCIRDRDISRLMVGRDVILNVEKEPASPKEALVKVRDLVVVDENGNCLLYTSFRKKMSEKCTKTVK